MAEIWKELDFILSQIVGWFFGSKSVAENKYQQVYMVLCVLLVPGKEILMVEKDTNLVLVIGKPSDR